MKRWILLAFFGLFVGCVSDLTVTLPDRGHEFGPVLAQVHVTDRRTPGIAASSRKAAFDVPMGNVTFNPPEAQFVQQALAVELTRLMREKRIQKTHDFSCEIIEFGVKTQTTPFYWDLVARIRLILRQGTRQQELSGFATERTYVWPSESIISSSVAGAMNQIILQLRDFPIE
jgi:hypothetical protein